MNRRLSEEQVRSLCRELLAKTGKLSGRALCAELRARFGAVGKTERVFAIWRDEMAARAQAVAMPADAADAADAADLKGRLAAAEHAAAKNLKRAELAEYRAQAHLEQWAMEVERLREELAALGGG